MSTETPTTPIEPHWLHSEKLMQHAFEELAKGERIQASEKAWGAMAHTLKAIADERGLTYGRHSQVWDVLHAVLADVDDSARRRLIRGGFLAAESLHRNFYDDVHLREDLDEDFEMIQSAIALLSLENGLWMERHSVSQ